jgi:hypothetical protein
MSRRSSRRAAASATLWLVLGVPFLVSACVVRVESNEYTTREEKRFTVAGTPDVLLVTFAGSIEIRSWDKSEVLVEVEKSGATKELADAIVIAAEQDGNRIRVEARRPDSGEWTLQSVVGASPHARILATLPRACNVLARSGDGSIQAEGLTGRVELRTGDGSVRGIDLSGHVRADTGDGSVKLEAVDGAVDVRTADGAVVVTGRLSSVRAETSDGSVVLTAEVGSVMADPWEVTTSDGGVVVYLPEPFDADLDASTGDGVIRADAGLGLGLPDASDKRVLRGRLGQGGRTFAIRTGDGSISLRRR